MIRRNQGSNQIEKLRVKKKLNERTLKQEQIEGKPKTVLRSVKIQLTKYPDTVGGLP